MKSKVLIFFLLLSFSLSCKQSNQELFEEFTDITIPLSAKVIKDEYQDMGQDYGKILEILLDSTLQSEIELSVCKSRFFNTSAFIDDNIISPELLRSTNKIKGVWYRYQKGYAFYGSTVDERENVTASVDTVQRIVKFQYLAN